LAGGTLQADGLEVRGQPEVGIDCGAQPCHLQRSRVVSSFAQAVGIRAGGDLFADAIVLEGPFKRAVEVEGGRAALSGLAISGAASGVHATGAQVSLADSEILDTRGPGVFAEGGTTRVSDCAFARNEFAVLVRAGAEATVAHSVVAAPRVSGVSGVQSRVSVVDHVEVEGGTDAALTTEGGSLHVDGALLVHPGASGVRAGQATIDLHHLIVSGARTEKDGSFGNLLFSFDDRVTGVDWDALECAGPAVEIQLGGGQVSDLLVEKGGLAGLDLENKGRLDVAGLEVHAAEGVGVACIEGGHSNLVLPQLDGARQGPWLVDCSCQIGVSPATRAPLRCDGPRSIPGVAP
jgi:hypothetical protein